MRRQLCSSCARSHPSDTWLILNNNTCPTPPTGEQRGFSCTVVGKPTRTSTTSRSTTRAQSPTVRVAGDQELLCSPTRRWFWHTGNPPLLRLIVLDTSSYSSALRNELLLRAAQDCSLRKPELGLLQLYLAALTANLRQEGGSPVLRHTFRELLSLTYNSSQVTGSYNCRSPTEWGDLRYCGIEKWPN